jgi:hypothetical protein
MSRAHSGQAAAQRTQELVGSIEVGDLLQAFGIDDGTLEAGRGLFTILKKHGDGIFCEF